MRSSPTTQSCVERTETLWPTLKLPATDILERSLANIATDRDEPISVQSRVEISAPARIQLFTLKLDPKLVDSTTEKSVSSVVESNADRVSPSITVRSTSTLIPSRVIERSDMELPSFIASITEERPELLDSLATEAPLPMLQHGYLPVRWYKKADILLLDEPTNHLDDMNVIVKWILDYLKSLVNVTCIIVSHDSMLIEQVVTHMLEIKDFKLKTSRASFPSTLPSTQKLKPISTSRRPPCLHISRSLVTLRA